MNHRIGKAIAIALAVMLCMACASSMAKGKPTAARYPTVLQGVWLGQGPEYCQHPDSGDSDSRFEIAPKKLTGYEDWQEPVRIQQISKDPKAWKVGSILHRDEYTFDIVEIMVLSSKDSMLTVVSDGHTKAYFRCQ